MQLSYKISATGAKIGDKMMEKMRKMISMLLVAVMLLGIPTANFAEELPVEPVAVEETVNEAPVAEPAPEQPKPVEQPAPAEEAPAAEEPKAEEVPVAEAPKAEEAPVAEEPKAEEAPVAEEPKAEEAPVEEPVAEEPVVEESVVEEPVAEEPVAKEPVAEEPVAEEPAAEEPVAEEPVAEEPVAEEPVAEEPVAEEPVVEEPVVEEPAVEEPAEAFTAKVAVRAFKEADLRLGMDAYLMAEVSGANMSYTVNWQSREDEDEEKPWEDIAFVGETYQMKLTADAAKLEYRCILTGTDGSKIISKGYRFPNSIYPAAAPKVEEPVIIQETPVAEEEAAVEEPVVEEPVAEEPVVEEPAAEEPVTEEPVAEEPVAEEPVAEETAAEEPAAEEPAVKTPFTFTPAVVKEPVAEEPVAEEPVVEEPAEEEPAVEEPIVFNFGGKEEPAEEIEIEDSETPLGLTEPQTIVLENNDIEVNVREGADGLAAIFTSLPEGAEVTVVNVKDDWATVIVNGELGYIYIDDIAGYLDLTEEELAEESAEAPVETPKKITIFTSRRTVMEEGEPVYLTSKLEGFEDCEEILYIWYVDKGNGFEVVEGANEATYTFTADAETLSWGWYLSVKYK